MRLRQGLPPRPGSRRSGDGGLPGEAREGANGSGSQEPGARQRPPKFPSSAGEPGSAAKETQERSHNGHNREDAGGRGGGGLTLAVLVALIFLIVGTGFPFFGHGDREGGKPIGPRGGNQWMHCTRPTAGSSVWRRKRSGPPERRRSSPAR